MRKKVSALLVHTEVGCLQGLESALQSLYLATRSARTCGEAAVSLWGSHPPHLVFTGQRFPDGTWLDVVELALHARAAVNVIVVMSLTDVAFYTQALERGAFDCILHPPFADFDLAHVVIQATRDVLERRKAAGKGVPPAVGA